MRVRRALGEALAREFLDDALTFRDVAAIVATVCDLLGLDRPNDEDMAPLVGVDRSNFTRGRREVLERVRLRLRRFLR